MDFHVFDADGGARIGLTDYATDRSKNVTPSRPDGQLQASLARENHKSGIGEGMETDAAFLQGRTPNDGTAFTTAVHLCDLKVTQGAGLPVSSR